MDAAKVSSVEGEPNLHRVGRRFLILVQYRLNKCIFPTARPGSRLVYVTFLHCQRGKRLDSSTHLYFQGESCSESNDVSLLKTGIAPPAKLRP